MVRVWLEFSVTAPPGHPVRAEEKLLTFVLAML